MSSAATPELEQARRAGADITDAARAAREARRTAVLNARAEGYTLQEIADVLGVSCQRVHQIAQTAGSAER
jgi:DNA-directed RNA polymerase specialized sigma24 family protein